MAEKAKVIIIDDQTSVIESFKEILRIKDYDVAGFTSGKEAIESVKNNKYDIAFVDLRMPEMDGIEVLKGIKKADTSVEVIIVTAYASEESFANAITLGAMEYLRKPFLMGEVYALADRAMRKRREKKK
ncbi:response regulator [Candidatus Margulisiibacteriota bacterium]